MRHILQIFNDEICSENLKVDDTPWKAALDKVKFEFFHTKEDLFYEIQPTTDMNASDSDLMSLLGSVSGDLPYAFAGPFIRGCVRLSLKK